MNNGVVASIQHGWIGNCSRNSSRVRFSHTPKNVRAPTNFRSHFLLPKMTWSCLTIKKQRNDDDEESFWKQNGNRATARDRCHTPTFPRADKPIYRYVLPKENPT